MLKEIRHALAATIAESVNGRVKSCPPGSVDMPSDGSLFAYVAPDADAYVAPWLTFSVTGHAELRFRVVVLRSDTGNPERDFDALDDAIDPQSTAPNVFGAILTQPDLGLPASTYSVSAAPLLEAVDGPRRLVEADGQVTYYEVVLPVQVIVQRS
jgi:hypothetical protein